VPKIEISQIYKVFGRHPAAALALAQEGKGKTEIREKTGCELGLGGIDLSIGAGQIFVIMGLSGSGKSTLVRHINRLIEPTSGKILFDGTDVVTMDRAALLQYRRRSVSMVFQSFGLFPHLTILQNVAYGRLVRGEPKAEAHAKALEWIETVGLKGYAAKYPFSLSGGMRQRVGLARALAADTDVILMDEAFSALDPLIRADMQDQLLELQQRLHKTIVFITHDLDEALRIGSKIAILRDGRLIQTGTADDILNRPADEYVARFTARTRHTG
jgi:glycine betaine/proline transport system ATP-binding protein